MHHGQNNYSFVILWHLLNTNIIMSLCKNFSWATACSNFYDTFKTIEWILHVNFNYIFGLLGFEKMFEVEFTSTTQGLPYDFSSIVHFQHYLFAYPHQSTLEPLCLRIPKEELGSSVTGTEFDFLHINLLYCQGNVVCLHENDAWEIFSM